MCDVGGSQCPTVPISCQGACALAHAQPWLAAAGDAWAFIPVRSPSHQGHYCRINKRKPFCSRPWKGVLVDGWIAQGSRRQHPWQVGTQIGWTKWVEGRRFMGLMVCVWWLSVVILNSFSLVRSQQWFRTGLVNALYIFSLSRAHISSFSLQVCPLV